MQVSIEEIQGRVEKLTAALIGLTAKEALQRETWNRERKEILEKIASINEIVGTKDTYGNGMAGVELTKQYGWQMVKPNRVRGQYFGMVVALEHHVGIVKISNNEIIELPFGAMAVTETQSPKLGDMVRMDFMDGVLTVFVVSRHLS